MQSSYAVIILYDMFALLCCCQCRPSTCEKDARHINKIVSLCAQKIKGHDNVHKLYQQQLLQEGVLKEEDVKRMGDHIGGDYCCSQLYSTMLAEAAC